MLETIRTSQQSGNTKCEKAGGGIALVGQLTIGRAEGSGEEYSEQEREERRHHLSSQIQANCYVLRATWSPSRISIKHLDDKTIVQISNERL